MVNTKTADVGRSRLAGAWFGLGLAAGVRFSR